MKKTATLIMTALLGVGLTGCIEQTDRDQRDQTMRLASEGHALVGMPNISNFQERRLMRQIMELRDQEDLRTYTYIVSLEGKLIFLGNSIGYGLPAAVQFTNPERIVRGRDVALPQPEANGLFMPDNLTATWIMLIDPVTERARPVYVEPQIVVSPFRLH